MNSRFQYPCFAVAAALWLGGSVRVGAQWVTQTNVLKAGWNAVFLHVDASHTNLDGSVGGDLANPIQEVWRWNPRSIEQFVDGPQAPTDTGSEWSSWARSQAGGGLQQLTGDTAYLVKVDPSVASYAWRIKGRPVPPRHEWTVTGLNFVGFPTVASDPPTFDTFVATAPELEPQATEVFQYVGGELTNNPVQVFTLRAARVNRGQAYWVRSGDVFNRYFGPFEVVLSTTRGAMFGDRLSTYNFRLRNLTANPLTITLELAESESAPADQIPIVGTPPLLVRGSPVATNRTYQFTDLPVGSAYTWTLKGRNQEGSETNVVLGLDRANLPGAAGGLLAGILRFTDSLGHSRVDVPVSAEVSSSAGLWVGAAAVTHVGQYLKTYLRDTNNTPLLSDVFSQVLDQSQPRHDPGWHYRIVNNVPLAQVFTVGRSGPLSRVAVRVDKEVIAPAPPPGDLLVLLRAAQDGLPTADPPLALGVIAESAIVQASSGGGQLYAVDFPDAPAVVGGESYALELRVLTGADGTNSWYRWHGAGEDVVDGQPLEFVNTNWVAQPGDFAFEIYVGDPAVTGGRYVVTGLNTDTGEVPTSFPLRLIVHNPAAGAARLLQRVYYGFDGATNPIVATREAALHRAYLSEARRISATHLPWSETNAGWTFNGPLGPAAHLTASVVNDFNNHAANPFLHRYHPDHDNLDTRFRNELAQGSESYTIVREITLKVSAPGNDFASRTAGRLALTGEYLETIRVEGLARGGGATDTRQFEVRGIFSLNHLANVSTLTTTP